MLLAVFIAAVLAPGPCPRPPARPCDLPPSWLYASPSSSSSPSSPWPPTPAAPPPLPSLPCPPPCPPSPPLPLSPTHTLNPTCCSTRDYSARMCTPSPPLSPPRPAPRASAPSPPPLPRPHQSVVSRSPHRDHSARCVVPPVLTPSACPRTNLPAPPSRADGPQVPAQPALQQEVDGQGPRGFRVE